MQYPIKTTNKYGNPVDERGKKIGAPKRLVGMDELEVAESHQYFFCLHGKY